MSDNDNDWGLDDFDAPDIVEQPQEGNYVEGSENVNVAEDVKPVKLSRAKTGLLIIAALMVVAIILITIKGVSVEKTVKNSQNSGIVNTAVTTAFSGSENIGDVGSENSEISAVLTDTVTTSAESLNPEIIQNTTSEDAVSPIDTITEPVVISTSSEWVITSSEVEVPNDDILSEVGVPQLSTELVTNGIVIGKHVYYYKGSYVYGVYISILFGDATKQVYYFCPKKTFDALSSADAIKVTYSFDSVGNVSITSISK